MAQQKEARLSQRIAKELRKRGALVIKIAGGLYQTPGLSDLFVIINGMFHALEVKRPRSEGGPGCDKGLTERQRLFLESVEGAGGISGCVESVEEAIELLYGKEPK